MIRNFLIVLVVALSVLVIVHTKRAGNKHDSNSSDQTYTVTKITDGDTVNVKDDSGNILKVRFICIDAPEKAQEPWGLKSKNRLSELVPLNSKVKLIKFPRLDKYKRTLAEVINHDGVNVNKKMVQEGLALIYPFSQAGCSADFSDLEAIARQGKLGVWSDKSFVKPWTFRKQRKENKHRHH